MRRTIVVVLCLLMAAACGGGQNGTSQSTTPKNGGSATIALENELRTLDPLDSSLLVEREVFYNMYDSLFTIDPKLVIKPGLVKQWDVADPVTYKFTLQSGVKFHDGTPFDAQSVKDNVTRYKTAANSRRKSDLNFVYRDMPALGFNGMELNTSAPPSNDPAKRKAVALAVDKYAILKNVYFNIGVVAYGPIPPSSWAFDGSEKVFDHGDAAKAKSMATGFTFTYKTTADPVLQQLAQLMAAELTKAGITMQVQSEDFATYQQECQNHQFQACNVNWSGRVDPDGNMYAWWHTGGDFNDSVYSNAQVDGWLDDARTTTDQTKRKQDYDNAQKQIVTDAPYVFSFFGTSAQISDNKIHDFTLYPDLMIRMAEVWKG